MPDARRAGRYRSIPAGGFFYRADILAELGLSLKHVVRATVYLKNLDDFAAMNRVYEATLSAPYPARSTPQVVLPFGALVGIEVTAYRRPK